MRAPEFEGQGSEFELKLDEQDPEGSTFRIKEEEPAEAGTGPAADSSSNQSLALESGETEAEGTEELSFELSLDEESTEVTPRPESAKTHARLQQRI
jgi:hypothetical protein